MSRNEAVAGGTVSGEATPREEPPETMPDGTTVRPWGWFDDGPGSPYLATQRRGRIYVMGFRRKGMNFAQPVFQVREGNRYGVMQTAAEIGEDWPRHPDAALIVEAVNAYDRHLGALRDILALAEGDALLLEHYRREIERIARSALDPSPPAKETKP